MSVMTRSVGAATVVGLLLVGAAGCGGSGTSGPAGSSTTTPTGASATASPTSEGSPSTAAPTTTASEDVEPPELVVTSPADDTTVTTTTLRFEGRTEPGATVAGWIQRAATVDADGNWSIDLVLEPGDNVARIEAVDASGNSTEVTVRVRCRLEMMSELIVGRWTGDVTVPEGWSPIEDFWVEFREDGSYSAGSTGTAFYYGTNDDYPEKVYSVSGHYPDGQPGSGTIAIVWAYDGVVNTVQQGSLENIVFSDAGDRLEFDFWNTWSGRRGPIHYDLVRSGPE